MLVQLNKETPVAEAEEEVRNTIRLVKDGSEFVYKDLVVRAASPQISHISNTLPLEGEKVIVYGANLQETLKLILPGGVEVSAGIESDEDGEWYSFTMPGGVSQGGSITSEGANAVSYTHLRFRLLSTKYCKAVLPVCRFRQTQVHRAVAPPSASVVSTH